MRRCNTHHGVRGGVKYILARARSLSSLHSTDADVERRAGRLDEDYVYNSHVGRVEGEVIPSIGGGRDEDRCGNVDAQSVRAARERRERVEETDVGAWDPGPAISRLLERSRPRSRHLVTLPAKRETRAA